MGTLLDMLAVKKQWSRGLRVTTRNCVGPRIIQAMSSDADLGARDREAHVENVTFSM